jgi:hypothetical protein
MRGHVSHARGVVSVPAALSGITRTERPRTDMRQHGRPLCRRSLGAGTETKHDKRTAPLTTKGRWALPRAKYSSRYDVLSPGKPTTDSGGILELALDPEKGKRPCAE